MLTINDLQKDTIFLLENNPHKILEVQHRKVARQGATVHAKMKNLITGSTLTRTFFPSDKFEEADIKKQELIYLYGHRGEYVFVDPKDRSKRYPVLEEDLEDKIQYLKENLVVTAEFFSGDMINIVLPIKVEYRVVEAPPAVRGNTAGAVTKQVKIESGAVITTPAFINTGDIIRVNTQKGEYVERVSKK